MSAFMRRSVVATCLATLATACPGRTSPLASTSGPFGVNGLVSLPQWPCTSCTGGISGTAVVSIVGIDQSGHAYTASWPDPSAIGSDLAATFDYTVSCPEPSGSLPPVTGLAVGNFVLSNGMLIRGVSASHGASLLGDITWQWAVDGLAITISGTELYDSGGALVAASSNTNNELLDGRLAGDLVLLSTQGLCSPTRYSIQGRLSAIGAASE